VWGMRVAAAQDLQEKLRYLVTACLIPPSLPIPKTIPNGSGGTVGLHAILSLWGLAPVFPDGKTCRQFPCGLVATSSFRSLSAPSPRIIRSDGPPQSRMHPKLSAFFIPCEPDNRPEMSMQNGHY